jgi:hypothetical protein
MPLTVTVPGKAAFMAFIFRKLPGYSTTIEFIEEKWSGR